MDDEIPPVGRMRDAAIALACGWKHEQNPQYTSREWSDYWVSPEGSSQTFPPRYSSDLTAAHSLGEEAARMGFAEEFTDHLFIDVACKPGTNDTWFAIAHASANARSAPWLRAWWEWKGRQDGTD